MTLTPNKQLENLLSRVRFFETPWTVAYQAPPSMGFSRQEYLSGMPFPSIIPTSAGEYQADEQAGVARLRWRVSGR